MYCYVNIWILNIYYAFVLVYRKRRKNMWTETCFPVNLNNCSDYYIDPCNCEKFYHCDKIQQKMFRKTCGPGRMFDSNNFVCGYHNDYMCHPEFPWQRCDVSDSRMSELRSMCANVVSSNNTVGGAQIAENHNLESTWLSLGALCAFMMLILILYMIWNRHRKKRQMEQGASTLLETEDAHYQSIRADGQNDIRQTRHNPLYMDGSIMMSPPSGPAGSEVFDRTTQNLITREEDVIYDNRAFSIDVRQFGSTDYPSTMPPPVASGALTELADGTNQSVITAEEEVVYDNSIYSLNVGQSSSNMQPTMGCDPRPPWPYKII